MANQDQDTGNVTIIEDYQKLKVTELKKLLKERALPQNGTKDELIERLKKANEAAEKLLDEPNETNTESTVPIDEELENEIMNDDTEKVTSTEAKAGVKRKPTENGETDKSEPPEKKLEGDSPDDTGKAEETSKEEDKNQSRLIKMSDGKSKDEVLELRTKKFGIDTGDKKALRAKRFGLTSEDSPTKETAKEEKPGDELLKKKRAERFGLNTSNEKVKVTQPNPEDEEKKKKRAERFGITKVPVIDINKKVQVDNGNPILSKTMTQRKLMRASRFSSS